MIPQSALITGAAKRIGKSFAMHLASTGWNVAIHYNKSKHEATKLYQELKKKYPSQRFELFRSDLQSPLAAEQLIPKVCEVMPDLSLLINNAAIFEEAPLLNSPFDLIERTFQINLLSPLIISRDFARHVDSGNIINITDTRITGNKADYAAYTLSKKSLWELTKMAALEFAPSIRTNAICLGSILPPKNDKPSYLEKVAKKVPMQETTTLAAIMRTLDFILDNDHIVGQQLFCDGGRHLGKAYEHRSI